jgi:hypothetical protein
LLLVEVEEVVVLARFVAVQQIVTMVLLVAVLLVLEEAGELKLPVVLAVHLGQERHQAGKQEL